jgi:hypothetical protein
MNFLDFKHLLLVDINSSGLSFYLAKDVKDLAAIDFTNLTLLKRTFIEGLCHMNLLADDQLLHQRLQQHLQAFDLNDYSLVFLITPGYNPLEKAALLTTIPLFKKADLVERHFFYNFYLMQKQNFSKIKLIINLFSDCVEVSLFNQQQLLASETLALRNLAWGSKRFFVKNKDKFHFNSPDCFYLFSNNILEKPQTTDLADYLKLEAIEIRNLCS